MELDTDKIDQAVLALLSLGRHEGYRVWKSFDWAASPLERAFADVLDRLAVRPE
jgi:hypothetical protein